MTMEKVKLYKTTLREQDACIYYRYKVLARKERRYPRTLRNSALAEPNVETKRCTLKCSKALLKALVMRMPPHPCLAGSATPHTTFDSPPEGDD